MGLINPTIFFQIKEIAMTFQEEEVLKQSFLERSKNIETELRSGVTPSRWAELVTLHRALIKEAAKQLKGDLGGKAIVASMAMKHAFFPFGGPVAK